MAIQKTSAVSSHKKGGKPKRKVTKLQEDTLLWAKLRAGSPGKNDKKKDCADRKKALLPNTKAVKPSIGNKSIVLAEEVTINKQNVSKLWEELTLESQRQQPETGSGVRKKLLKYWANFLSQ